MRRRRADDCARWVATDQPGASLVIATDVTELRSAELARQAQAETVSLLSRYVQDPDGLAAFVEETSQTIGALRAGAAPAVRARRIHTLKGNAAMLGALSLRDVCHEVKSRVAELACPIDDADVAMVDLAVRGDFARFVMLLWNTTLMADRCYEEVDGSSAVARETFEQLLGRLATIRSDFAAPSPVEQTAIRHSWHGRAPARTEASPHGRIAQISQFCRYAAVPRFLQCARPRLEGSHMNTKLVLGSAIATLSIAAFGCESTNGDRAAHPEPSMGESQEMTPSTTADTAVQPAQPPTGTDTAQQPAQPETTGMPAATAEMPSDAQILAILDAANDKEIEESKAILAITKNKNVKAFAEMMVKHHGEAKKKAAKLASTAGLSPAENADAKKLMEKTQADVARLKGMTGAELDAAYVQLMVDDHKEALDLVDKKLMPAAKNADLKKMIETDLRPTIESHHKQAQELAKKVTPGQPPTASR